MRILLTTDPIGGVWTFTKDLTLELLKRGHEVALVSLGRTPTTEQQQFCHGLGRAYEASLRFVWSDAPLEWMQENQLAYEGAAPLLQHIADEFQPEVFHSSQFCFGRLPLGIPKLITAHSDVLSWAEACRPEGLEASPWLERYVALVQDGLASADAVAAPTAWMLSAFQANFATPLRTCVIANGRGISDCSSAVERKLQAVSAGRLWDEGKNLHLLAQIHSPVPILIAGQQQHESAAAPLSGSLRFLGELAEEALTALLRESSIYLAPSVYEPFGLAPLEAALCGCAVLANDIPSLREVWGDAALYFQDQSSLESLLEQLLASPEMLAGARAASYQRAMELTASGIATAYLALYDELLQPPTAAPEYELTGHAS